MITERQLPSFVTAEWYSDPTEHRCPHDAWLKTFDISEPASGERGGSRSTAITLKLLGAYHDGHIIFRYVGVKRYSLESSSCERGLGDWLRDEMSVSHGRTLLHRITWAGFGPGQESQWCIEAEDVSYEWIPQTG
jgi:hypothetical protein